MTALLALFALEGVHRIDAIDPSTLYPVVQLRWRMDLDAPARTALERQFALATPEVVEGTTWRYRLDDASSSNLAAIVRHPAVLDTHHIDRDSFTFNGEQGIWQLGALRLVARAQRAAPARAVAWVLVIGLAIAWISVPAFVSGGLVVAAFCACLTLGDWAVGAMGYAREWNVLTGPPDVDAGPGDARVRSNAEGAPDEYVGPKQPGERRALVAGDSLARGWGLPEEARFSRVMQDRLGIRVINVSRDGQETSWFRPSFEFFSEKYRPDYYFVCVFSNDVSETNPNGNDWKRGAYARDMTFDGLDGFFRALWPHTFVLLQKRLGFHPHLERYLGLAILEAADSPAVEAIVQRARSEHVSEERIREWRSRLLAEDIAAIERKELGDGIVSLGLIQPRYWIQNLDLEGADAARRWNVMRADLGRLFDAVRARGVIPFLVYMPHPVQYDPAYIKPAYARFGVVLRPEWFGAPSELQRRLAALAEESRVPFIDLQPALAAYPGDKTRLYFPGGDPHLQREGHLVAGKAIADSIVRDRLLDAPVVPAPPDPRGR